MDRLRGRKKYLCLFCAVVLAAGCSGCAPVQTHRPGVTPQDRDDYSSVSAGADSLDALGQALSLSEIDLASDQVHIEELADELSSASLDHGPPERPGPGRKGAWAGWEGLRGYRENQQLEAGLTSRLRVGWRSSNDKSNGYAEIAGAGPVNRIVLGSFRPRFGEGLLLGARYSLFGLPRRTWTGGAVAAHPTASVWNRQRGAAASLSVGATELSLAGWTDTGVENTGGYACWTSITRHSGGCELGAAVGAGRRAEEEAGGGSPGGVDLVFFAGKSVPPGAISGELARYRGQVFAAVRSSVHASGDWSVEVFNGPVPSGFSSTVIGPGDLGRRQWGGAVHRVERVRGVYTRVSLYSNRQRSETSQKIRRRAELEGRGRDWEVSVRWAEEETITHSTRPIEYSPRKDTERHGRFRLTWKPGGVRGFRQFYRLQLLKGGEDAGSTGVLGTIGLSLAAGGLEARFQVNNYSLAPGQVGYVTRPGIAGYETVSAVGGTGSDLSSRVRVNLFGKVRLGLFWGQPWGREQRFYALVRISV